MKRYLILFLMLTIKICAQDQTASEKIDNYHKYLKPYTENPEKCYEIATLSDNELKHYIKLQYEATESDFKLLSKKALEHSREVEKLRKGEFYGVIKGAFENVLKKKYPENFLQFLDIPYLVKARITSIRDSIHEDKSNPEFPMGMMITVMDFSVIEVIKGNKEFKTGKTYGCYYGKGWRNGGEDFLVGMTCLLPIDPREQPKPKENEYLNAIITYLDDNCGLFKIEDGNLYDKYNFFSLGNVVPWAEFVSGFNKKVEAIKKGEF